MYAQRFHILYAWTGVIEANCEEECRAAEAGILAVDAKTYN